MVSSFKMHLVALLSLGSVGVTLVQPASAQVEPFLGQAMIFSGNFCPQGWAPAAGQLLSISQHSALYSILGTTFGGNGQTTFALPNAEPVKTLKPGAVFTMCIALEGVYPPRN